MQVSRSLAAGTNVFDMHEDIGLATVGPDEAEAPLRVEAISHAGQPVFPSVNRGNAASISFAASASVRIGRSAITATTSALAT